MSAITSIFKKPETPAIIAAPPPPPVTPVPAITGDEGDEEIAAAERRRRRNNKLATGSQGLLTPANIGGGTLLKGDG
jgi:hypothetical protein